MKNRDINLFIDSGAFSAWSQNGDINIDDYITFCLKNDSMLEVVASLDIIPGKKNQKITKQDIKNCVVDGWNNYRKMLSSGIPKHKLLHTFHLGEDMKWLERMVKEGIPYIGLGVANGKNIKHKITWLDECMNILTDSIGMPIVKFHGFGITSLKMMARYPFYSCDSSTWTVAAAMGDVFIPQYKNNKWVYANGRRVTISNRSINNSKHWNMLSPIVKKQALLYFEEKDIKLGVSHITTKSNKYELKENESWFDAETNRDKRKVEEVIEYGLINDYRKRKLINFLYFLDLEKTFPEWPFPFKYKKNIGFNL